MGPEIKHHPLSRADGSVTFSDSLFSLTVAVNGPVEVQRRDELPEEAAIEVNIRPASGVGGPRERWLEMVVAAVLRNVVLVHLHPRALVQLTVQITKEPALKLGGAVRDTALLPSLVNAAFLALVDGALPLETTVSAVLCAATASGEIKVDPSEKDLVACRSLHALACNQHGQLLLDESHGKFTLEQWEEVIEVGARDCLAATTSASADAQMTNGSVESEPWLRHELEERARETAAWRGG